ncbi:hypothetical protein FRB99_007358 [Tulasnella sp. 403]|nr:hypothetical protein FRB99_007358 [Tulasnella sp. 403]
MIPRPTAQQDHCLRNQNKGPSLLPFLFIILLLPFNALGQLVNGQFFTEGLSILNSPLPNQQFNAGGNIPVSIEVSGDGRLPKAAFTPNSNLPTAFISLNLYLASALSGVNVTISGNSSLLAGEPGSTVKHLSWYIPDCLPAGQYNFTIYELSKINGQPYFSITPIPISIQNPYPTTSTLQGCSDVTLAQPEPQKDNPLGVNPFLSTGFSLITGNPTPSTATGGVNSGLPAATTPTRSSVTSQIQLSSAIPTRFITSVVTLPDRRATTLTIVAGSTTTTIDGVVTVIPPGGTTSAILSPLNGATRHSSVRPVVYLFLIILEIPIAWLGL